MNRANVDVAFRCVAIAAMAVVQIAWLTQPISIWLKVFHLALLGLALARPTDALLVLAGLAWLSTVMSSLAGSPYSGAKLLEQMVLATITGALTRRGAPHTRTRLAMPMLLFAAVAAASAIAVLPARMTAADPGATFRVWFLALWRGDYFQRPPVWDPLSFAMLAVESALLAWAVERAVRRTPEIVDPLLRTSLMGSAGASLVNLYPVVSGALRTAAFWPNFVRIFSLVRYSGQTDANAASSTFLLAFFGGMPLIRAKLRQAVPGALFIALTAIGLWIAGSRIAFVGLLIGLLFGATWFGWRGNRRTRQIAVASFVATALAGALFVTFYPHDKNWNMKLSIENRSVLFGAGVTMFKSAPIMGIGIGRFYERSGELVGPDLLRIMSDGQDRENAHNNFLQTLAEQGIVGLVALLLLLGTVCVGVWRGERLAPDRRRRWLFIALVACLVTWLTGHPLLAPEFAFVFWLYVAVLAGLTSSPAVPRLRWIVVAATAAVIISAPIRATQALRAANLEHLGVGVSQWQHDADVPYRRAGQTFALYVPAEGANVRIPAQRAPGAPDPLNVEMSIDGRLVDVQVVSGDEWQFLSLLVPRGKRRYVLVEFTIANAPPGKIPRLGSGQAPTEPEPSALIRVGKTAVR